MKEGEQTTTQSRKEQHLARMRKKYPDKKFEDDEEIYGAISDDYDNYEQELGGFKEREKVLSDMFAADPRSAQFLTDMRKGNSPWASYIRLFGPELKESLDDPETLRQIAEAETEYVERVAKSRKLDEEYERNMETTLETLRQFQQEHNMSDEEINQVVALLLGIIRDGVMGKFVPETLEMAVKALNHDEDVALASEEGEIAGRNAKITEKLRRRNQGDGVTALNGKNSTGTPAQSQRKSIFDLAAEAQ